MDPHRKLLLQQRLNDPEYMDRAVNSIAQNMAEKVVEKNLTGISEILKINKENNMNESTNFDAEMITDFESLKDIPRLISNLREENQKLRLETLNLKRILMDIIASVKGINLSIPLNKQNLINENKKTDQISDGKKLKTNFYMFNLNRRKKGKKEVTFEVYESLSRAERRKI